MSRNAAKHRQRMFPAGLHIGQNALNATSLVMFVFPNPLQNTSQNITSAKNTREINMTEEAQNVLLDILLYRAHDSEIDKLYKETGLNSAETSAKKVCEIMDMIFIDTKEGIYNSVQERMERILQSKLI